MKAATQKVAAFIFFLFLFKFLKLHALFFFFLCTFAAALEAYNIVIYKF